MTKNKILVVIGVLGACLISFIAGRTHQAKIDYQQAILFDSRALAALDEGNISKASSTLEAILWGNLINLNQVKHNPFWPSYPAHEWKDTGSSFTNRLNWTRERIKKRSEKTKEESQPATAPYSESASRSPQG